jgi:hypothetical protein
VRILLIAITAILFAIGCHTTNSSTSNIDAAATDASLTDTPVADASMIDVAIFPTTCAPCGPLNPCANGGCCVSQNCVGAGHACTTGLGVCANASCGGCGALNEPCCLDQTGNKACGTGVAANIPLCSDPNTICSTAVPEPSVCVACGGLGQPCCGTICTGSLACDKDAVCVAECGDVSEPCCLFSPCGDGGICLGYPDRISVCVAGSVCNADAGACTSCGLNGLPCCGDGGCEESNCEQGMCPPIPKK